ncbi:MAG: hypothetical protein KF813_07215 [Trueperaceae bacterium]|nr:hypothetical protein [Trueperaceae bacterium]
MPDVFVPANEWEGEFPEDAEIVSPEELQRRFARGELILTSTAKIEATFAEQQAQYEADVAALAGFAGGSEALQDLLTQAAERTEFESERTIELEDGSTFLVNGIGNMLRSVVEAQELSQSVENALDNYDFAYMLLPEELRSGLPTPQSLAGSTLDEVRDALAELDALLTTSFTFQDVRQEDEPFWPSDLEAAYLRPGIGTDRSASCASPTGYVAGFWFPLKEFISPVKDQANRGTCWAFTSIGAIESRERVQNDRSVNLSEQFLVHKVKVDWASSDYNDGYRSAGAVTGAANRGQTMMYETQWTYNPSHNRVGGGDVAAAYAGSCDPYGTGPNGGSCSDTAHQSPRVCAHGAVKVCGFVNFGYSGGIPSTGALQVWGHGERFDLARLRLLLDQGHVLMAGFFVHAGFFEAERGVVTDFSRTYRDEQGNLVGGSAGGHEALIVGFIPNSALRRPGGPTPNIPGGGYFILQNSWGCGAGDGGFYYLPAKYVQDNFTELSILAFDSRRGSNWRESQAVPGGLPNIRIDDRVVDVDVRVETNLGDFFYISHPVARSVHLRATHSVDGLLYNGTWSIDPESIIPSRLWHTFGKVGSGEVRLEVTYNGRVARHGFTVRAVNTPPTAGFSRALYAYVGEPYPVGADLYDKNEPDQLHMCSTARWSVGPGHTVSPSTGCLTTVTFSQTGSHALTLSVTDRDGATTTETTNVDVLPAPANPYPRITDPGVFAILTNDVVGCFHSRRQNGTTIDLRQWGCNVNPMLPLPRRHYATISVENPSGETLSYDWRLFMKLDHAGAQWQLYDSAIGSSSSSFPLRDLNRVTAHTADCYVNVTVNAPQPGRSKTQTVWTGRCIATFGTNPR